MGVKKRSSHYTRRTTLHNLLDKVCMSQKMFATEMGVDGPTVSYWLSGRRIPQADRIEKMAELLQVTPEKLNAMFITENIIFFQEETTCRLVAGILHDIIEDRFERTGNAE